jgi:1-phosphofructokinase
MIYTCTLNPSIDHLVYVDDFKEGDLNRSQYSVKYPGGKGINVSRLLRRFGIDNTALGFIGGFTGDFIKNAIESEGVNQQFIHVIGDSRINIKLKSKTETEINGEGPLITNEDIQLLTDQIKALQTRDLLVIAGSIPKSLPTDFYTLLVRECDERGIKTIVDVGGNELKEVLPYKPFLVKPNHHELSQLFDTNVKTVTEAAVCGRKVLELGAQNVIVSMAGEGALFLNNKSSLYANVPKGEVKNSVGAGDSVVAGFLASYVHGKSFEEAFRFGVAAGSATAFSSDVCTKEYVDELVKQIKVEKV